MRCRFLAAALALMGCGQLETLAPDVFLLTLDTTRADALGVYGADPSPSPFLDELAASGLVVSEAQTTVPLTLPAHASMLLGRYPHHHGIRDNGKYPDPQGPSLFGDLQSAGYATGAFVSAVVLDDAFGLDEGFDVYEDEVDPTMAGQVPSRPANDTVARARSWLREQPDDRPLGMWVHLYDSHHPLTPPPEFQRRFPGDPYAAAVAFMDAQLEELLAEARAHRDRPRLVVVAGDHGESNGEHGEQTHGYFVYRSTMRVPLFFAGEGVQAGRREALASLVDIYPTVAGLLDMTPAGELDGVDLLATEASDRAVLGESHTATFLLGAAPLHVAQDGTHRWIGSTRSELYDWVEDPGELQDLSAAHGLAAVAAELERALPDDAAVQGMAGALGDLGPALAALGYFDAPRLSPDVGLDPKDTLALYRLIHSVQADVRRLPPEAAARVLTDLVDRYPDIPSLQHLLAVALLRTADVAGARAAYEAAAATADGAVLASLHAALLLAEGQTLRAEAVLREHLSVAPENTDLALTLAELLRGTGRCGEAQEVVNASLRLSPRSSRLLLVRAACAYDGGDLVGATYDLEQALAITEADADIWFLRGVVHAKEGALDKSEACLDRALALGPHPLASEILGLVYYKTDRREAALQRFGELGPSSSPDVLAAATDILLLKDDLSGADRTLRLLESQSPPHASQVELRSRYEIQSGHFDVAQETLKERSPG